MHIELASTPWHIFGLALIFLLGILISQKINRVFGVSNARSLTLYFWHSLLCIVSVLYTLAYGSDSIEYYTSSLASINFSVGTAAIGYIASFFTQIVGLSFLGLFFVFNIFGFVGLLAFDGSMKTLAGHVRKRHIRWLTGIVAFIPSASFWSAFVGKDALSFMAANLALWAVFEPKKRTSILLVSFVVMLLVRPHIAGVMVVSFAFSVVADGGLPMSKRMLLGALATGASVLIIPFALNYSGVGSGTDISGVQQYIETRQAIYQGVGSGIDISSMSLPVKVFTYAFRPLPFEASSLTTLATSIENVLLLYLALYAAWVYFVNKRRAEGGGVNRTFMWIYSGATWVVLAMVTSNLGIASRQKWMFFPFAIFLFLSVIGGKRQSRIWSPVTYTSTEP